MKRKTLFFLVGLLFLVPLSLRAYDFKSGDLYYNITSSKAPYTVAVTYEASSSSGNYSGLTTAVIPETVTYNGNIYAVTSIENKAFDGCTGLTSVTIPESVTSIGDYAFYKCSSLTSITIPENVRFFGQSSNWGVSGTACSVFVGCEALTTIIWNAISYPNDFRGAVPYQQHHCINSPFYEIRNQITSFTFGDKVKVIPALLCYGMSQLTSITIPKSVVYIGASAFHGCTRITKTNYTGNIVDWCNIDIRRPYTMVMYETRYTPATIPSCYSDNLYINDVEVKDLVIPDGVTAIGNCAFDSWRSLTSVTIPESVTSIGDYAFRGCTGLTSITIPDSVTSIGSSAFEGCTGLTSITIPDSVTSIGSSAFEGCTGLTSVTIPESVTSIGDYAFYGCTGLTSVTIPDGVTSIGRGAFYGCTGLTSITIPESVTSIGNNAFYNVPNINIVRWITGYPWGARNLNGYVEGYLVYASATKAQLLRCSTAATGEIIIPESVTMIGDNAFYGCTGLTSVIWNAKNCSIFVYDSSNNKSTSPFYDLRSQITSFTFGEEVEHVPAYLCYGMSNLTSLTIPNNVASVGNYAFSGCTGLTSVIWNAKNCSNFVYDSSNNKSTSPFYDLRSQITSFTFGEEVEHVPAYLCYGMSNLTSLTIPNNVASVGNYAFSGCTGLTSATIGNGVMSIGDYAFAHCTGLTSATIGNGVMSIGDYAFAHCTGLTKTNYTGNIAGWCNIDFTNRSANPILYSHNLYINDVEVKDLVITDGVTTIKDYAFSDCTGLTSVTISNSVTSIGESAFYRCTGLTSITIPSSVTSIGEGAFSNCTGLTSVTCEAITPPACGDYVFNLVPDWIPVYIPCGTIDAYQSAEGWNGLNLQAPPMPSIAVYSNDTEMGQVELEGPKQNLDCEAVASFSATPNFGYHFVQWSDGDTRLSRTVTLTQDTTLTAMFAKDYSGKCGDNLYWQYKDNGLYITGFGTMYNYTETTQPWLLLADSIHTIYTDNTATSIGEYAFANLGKLTQLRLGVGLETVGANAFAGCLRLGNIHCYAALPPLAEESSFANYNARLYVPCEVLGDYQLAIVFGNFKYIDCISSDGVDVPTNTVTVTPSYEDATFTWPSNGNANAYTLEITKDGVVFCTLTFNANGQLMGIAFAPSKDRNNAHAPQAAQATTNGWQFTVTGLNEGSNYAYTMTVTDNGNTVLQTYEGTFTTLGGDLPEGLTQTSEAATGIQKVIRDGQVLILRNGKTYTLTGQEIR